MSEAELLPAPNALAIIETLNAVTAYAPGGIEKILDAIERDVRATRRDISTDKGRKLVKSLAYKVARSKTALDDLGKDAKEDAQKRVDGIDADRRLARTRLDALKVEVLAELEAWETAEANRIKAHEAALIAMEDLARFDVEPTPAQITERIEVLSQMPGTRNWQEFSNRAVETFSAIDQRLFGMHALAVERAEEAAELERLRAAEAERQTQEAARQKAENERRIAHGAAEAARIAAEAERDRLIAEERAAAAWAAEEARHAALRREREAEERAEAERAAAQTELDRVERERKAEIEKAQAVAAALAVKVEAERAAREATIAAVNERAEKAERARLAAIEQGKADVAAAQAEALALAERARKAKIAAEQQAIWDRDAAVAAEQKRVADEKAKRDAEEARRAQDKAHRGQIHRDILAALVGCGAAEPLAKIIIASMARAEVPHVSVSY